MASGTQRDTGSQTPDGDESPSQAPEMDRFDEADEAQNDSFDAGVSDEERRRMIAEAAYFIAQRRDFDGGLQLDDWLAAEAEVNTRLALTRKR